MLVPLFMLITISVYYIVKDIFHPAFMLIFFWTIGLVTLAIFPDFYFPSLETQWVIFYFLFLFTVISLITGFIIKFNASYRNISHISVEGKTLFFISHILMVGLIVYLFRYIEIIASFNSLAEYFYNIRYAAIHTSDPLIATGAFLSQIKTFSMVLSLILMYEIYRNNLSRYYKLHLLLFIALTLLANIAEGARNEAVYLLLVYAALYVYMKGTQSIFKVIFIFLSLLLLLSMFTRGINSDSFFETLYSFMNHIAMYGFGSIVSFETFLEDDSIQIYSGIMIKLTDKINNILDLFGLSLVVHPDLQQTGFADIGKDMRTNVYSFLAVRISYFGIIGASISIAIHAIIITVVYKLKNKSIYMFLLYLLMIPTTILTLFHEYFFAMSPYYLRALILIFILYTLKPLQQFRKYI